MQIAEMVVRGEIDNTEEGVTRGRVWLCGREQPLELRLAGDCWRDLAGARLRFSNPRPRADGGEGPEWRQHGVVGDMTASRRARAGAVWSNVLSLEWFSEADGRVVLEAAGFELEVVERLWEMDADAEHAQKLANLQAMRDFLARSVGRPVGDDEQERGDFEWERRVLASERLAEAFREVREKYRGQPDADRMEAFAMGWDGLLEAMASETEAGGSAKVPAREPFDERWADDQCGEDAETAEHDHPLRMEAGQLARRARDLVGKDCPTGSDGAELAEALRQVAARLAGALNGSLEAESGYVLALLKRSIEALVRSHLLCTRLIEVEDDNDQERALESLRDEISELREELAELRAEFGG